jgi:CheY-like chemotaxis protein
MNKNFIDDNENLVLVVEDDDISFLLIKAYLDLSGITAIRSSTGTHAIEICKTNPGISLVLLDLRLPDINGVEVCKAIKSFRPDLTVIFQSATVDPKLIDLALRTGAMTYITKPFSYNDLKSALPEEILKVH